MADSVCKFLTRRKGKPLTFGIVIDQRGGEDHSAAGLRGLALMANRHPGSCAYGKVVLLRDRAIHSFQALANGDLLPAFCGNSTAAAIACLGVEGAVRTRVVGNGSECEVEAQVVGDEVIQTWMVRAERPRERRWRGRRVLTLSTLNDYAIVEGALPVGTTATTARRELLGNAMGKLAILAQGPGGQPTVEFYNSNGRHGAVPQTGAATIALACRYSPWLRAHFPDNRLTYISAGRSVSAALPFVIESGPRISIALPATEISITALAMDMVA